MAETQKSFKACSVLSVSLVLLLWLNFTATASMADTRTVPVGVILDLTSKLGLMAHNSLILAVDDYYSVNNPTAKIELKVRNISENDVVAAADAARHLIEDEEVHAILGPQNSELARYIVKLGEESHVPVIWFPMTGPSLLPPPSPSSIYSHQGLNCLQFQAIADIVKALGWQSIVPIYEKTEYGSQLIPCLTNVLKDMGIRMANVTAIDPDLTDYAINSTLDNLNNMRTHVFVVHLSMDFGARFIKSAEAKEMVDEGYAWILTQELSSLTDPQVNITRKLYYPNGRYTNFTDHVRLKSYMQGALGVRPIDSNKTGVRLERERNFTDRFINSSLTIYGWWAYHTLEALAMALEKPGTDNNGTKLGEEIRATNFTGKSGLNFSLNNGQLDQSKLEVYNVIGARERIIASWSPETGLVQNFSKGGDEKSGEYPLKDPLWPGDTLDKPPKLRIGVPTTNSTPELVNVDTYNSSKPLIYGFAITVFLKAVDVLPFPLKNFDFVPLPNEGRNNTPTYDDILCRQMKVKDLDAIIGDITIVESRTKCVDFTLPYLDSSVTMMVRLKAAKRKGILFKPFKWSLWLILGGIFVAATIIIIVLESYKTEERNKIKEFRYNPFLVYKLDVMGKFQSRAAGWMVILTSFLFILVVQVYTANLTSILTQEKIKEPSFKNASELISRNLPVGYQNGSWVRSFLVNQIGLKDDQLKALGSRGEYHKALSKGGEVDAIFDEIPYLTLFLSKYKSGFMMTGPIYKTGGFAFAFPKKSGLASHFSTAILNVTQDAEPYRMMMAKNSIPTSVEDLEFEDESDIGTTRLSITNFGGLYPVILSVVALVLGLFILNPSMFKRLHQKAASQVIAKG